MLEADLERAEDSVSNLQRYVIEPKSILRQFECDGCFMIPLRLDKLSLAVSNVMFTYYGITSRLEDPILVARDAEAVKFLWKWKHFEERSWKRKRTRKHLAF